MARTASTPNLQKPFATLEDMVMLALRQYGDSNPGTMDGDTKMMFIGFANDIIEEIIAHPYWLGAPPHYYTHQQETRMIPDTIMIAGLKYHYAVQQQSSKAGAYGPIYYRTMNRVLYNRLYGNTTIELGTVDVADGTQPQE